MPQCLLCGSEIPKVLDKVWLVIAVYDDGIGIRAVCTKEELAIKAKIALEKQHENVGKGNAKFIVEDAWLNHMFGYLTLKTLEKGS